jgi:undecaprenyl-diphosphatase
VANPDQRLAWLLVLGTIPVGIVGLLFEHTFRTTFGKPLSASIALFLNGLILFGGEFLRRRAPGSTEYAMATVAVAKSGDVERDIASDHRVAAISTRDTVLIGSAQIGALFSGISRSGIAMTAGLLRGLSHEDAARFSFLLATPVILAAGVLKLPDLTGPLGNGVRGQILVGSILSGIGAYLSVRFLDRYFQTRTLTPFAIYCVIAGAACAIRFGVF